MINYYEYINSKKWKYKSKLFTNIVKKCKTCSSNEGLGCHHKHYNTLGRETLKDVEILCWRCHKKLHNHMGDRTELKPKYRKRVIFNGKPEKGKMGISKREADLIGSYCIKKQF